MDLILQASDLFLVWGLPLAWLVFQVLALIGLRGRARIWSALPVIAMLPVAKITYTSFLQHSNLWPLLLILASVPALWWVLKCISLSGQKARKLLWGGTIGTMGLALTLWPLLFHDSHPEETRRLNRTIQKLQGLTIRTASTTLLLNKPDLEGQDPDKLLVAQEVFRASANQYIACYESSFSALPRPTAYLFMSLVVDAGGSTQFATVTQSTLHNQAFEQCVQQAMQRLNFGPQKDNKSYVFRFPMWLRPTRNP